MKKQLFGVLLALTTTLSLAACTGEGGSLVHIHDYASMQYDETSHWSVCSCGNTTDPGNHSYSAGKCTECGAQQPSEGLEFQVGSSSCSVTGLGTCTDTELVIPAQYNGLPVTSIGRWAFQGCDNLKSVVVPNSVTHIYDRAFWLCTSLESITLPDSLTYIDAYVFWECASLKRITIPETVTHIGDYAFSRCTSLTEITIPNKIGTLSSGLFYGCTGLKSISLPGTVTVIYDGVCYDCTSLTDIHFQGTKAQWNAMKFFFSSFPGARNRYWLLGSGEFTVHCKDGDVAKADCRLM